MNIEPTEHKSRLGIQRKIEPVQFYLDHYLRTLSILNGGRRIGVNEIFRNLKGIDKSKFSHKKYTIDAIRHLKRGNLVVQTKEPNKKKLFSRRKWKKQKLVTELTDSGKELSNSISKYFDIGGNNGKPISISQFNYRLKVKGWEKKDIGNYPNWLEEVYQVQYLSSLAIIETLVARYFSIMSKFNLRGLAKEILTFLIVNTLREYLFSRLEGLPSEMSSSDRKQSIYNGILNQLTGRTMAYFLNYAPPIQKNKFIQSESVEVVKSLYKILDPSTEFLKMAFGLQANRDPTVRQQLDYLASLGYQV